MYTFNVEKRDVVILSRTSVVETYFQPNTFHTFNYERLTDFSVGLSFCVVIKLR